MSQEDCQSMKWTRVTSQADLVSQQSQLQEGIRLVIAWSSSHGLSKAAAAVGLRKGEDGWLYNK